MLSSLKVILNPLVTINRGNVLLSQENITSTVWCLTLQHT